MRYTKYVNVGGEYLTNVALSKDTKVGETTITISGDKIILKAGGVEVVIDSNGLVVKGGEIKSE